MEILLWWTGLALRPIRSRVNGTVGLTTKRAQNHTKEYEKS